MRKVYLVNLPSPFMTNDLVHPPYGLMYLHEYLAVHGVDVDIVDLAGDALLKAPFFLKSIEPLSVAESLKGLLHDPENIVGISSTTPQYPYARALATTKRAAPNTFLATLAIGGIHATALPRQCLDDGFDAVVMGEGEDALLEMTKRKKIHRDAFLSCFYEDIDEFPHPRLSSIDANKYALKMTYTFQGATVVRNAGWLMVTRGCAYDCAFCGSRCMWNNRVRYHTRLKYLKRWVRYWGIVAGVNDFHFIDEQIPRGNGALYELCDVMKETGGIWRCASRGDAIGPMRVDAMYKAGCRQITVGVETGSQRLLDLMNKGERVESNRKAIKTIRNRGMGVKASVMTGIPTETQEDVDETCRLLEETKPDEVSIATFVPYPGSDVYKDPDKYDYKIDRSLGWDQYVTVGKDEMPPTIEKGKGDQVRKWRQQLIDAAGDAYVLKKHKERWEKW